MAPKHCPACDKGKGSSDRYEWVPKQFAHLREALGREDYFNCPLCGKKWQVSVGSWKSSSRPGEGLVPCDGFSFKDINAWCGSVYIVTKCIKCGGELTDIHTGYNSKCIKCGARTSCHDALGED